MTEFTGEVHPAAAVFPMLTDDELDQLAESIAEDGLLQALVLTPEGALLDGRNRLAACERAGVEPTFVVYDGDPVGFVAASNVHRRHMSTGARAMAVAQMLYDAGRRSNGRWKRGSVPDADNGELSNTNWSALMKRAGRVIDYAPDLAPLVIAGATSLHAAVKEATDRAESADDDAGHLAELAVCAPDLHQRVIDESDPTTLSEAMAAWKQRQRDHQEDVNRRVSRLKQLFIGWIELAALINDDGGYPTNDVLDSLDQDQRDRLQNIVAAVEGA